MRDFDTADDVREVLMQDWGVALDDDARLWWVGPRNDARLANFGLALHPPAPLLASLLSLAGARKIRRGQSAPQEDSAKLCKSTAASCAAQLKLMHQLSAQGMAREGARMAEATMLREVTEEVAGATEDAVRRELEGAGQRLRAVGTACPFPSPSAVARTTRSCVLPCRRPSPSLSLPLPPSCAWASRAFCGACGCLGACLMCFKCLHLCDLQHLWHVQVRCLCWCLLRVVLRA